MRGISLSQLGIDNEILIYEGEIENELGIEKERSYNNIWIIRFEGVFKDDEIFKGKNLIKLNWYMMENYIDMVWQYL